MPSPSFIPVIKSATAGNFTAGGTVSAGGQLLGAEFSPADHGFETWTHDPYSAASSASVVNGRVYAVKLPLRRQRTLTALWWSIATGAVTPTAGQSEVGIYDSAGIRLNSINVDGVMTSASPKRSVMAASLRTSFVWQLFVFNAATPPVLARGSSFEAAPSMNLPTTALRAAVVADGATALPASFSPASLSTSNCLTLFAALECTAP